MRKIEIQNPLLFWTWLLVAVYWIVGPLIPSPYISIAASIFLLSAGVLNAWKYGPDTYLILFKQLRSQDEGGEGSHIGVYGVFLLSIGSIWSGVYGVSWILADQPASWSATVFSSFGRVMMGAGFVMMWISPRMSAGGGRPISQVVIAVVAFVALCMAVMFGGWLQALSTQNEIIEFTRRHGDERPQCPGNKPVWGTVNGRYHIPGGKYRAQIIPYRCFADELSARRAGYQPPKR